MNIHFNNWLYHNKLVTCRTNTGSNKKRGRTSLEVANGPSRHSWFLTFSFFLFSWFPIFLMVSYFFSSRCSDMYSWISFNIIVVSLLILFVKISSYFPTVLPFFKVSAHLTEWPWLSVWNKQILQGLDGLLSLKFSE